MPRSLGSSFVLPTTAAAALGVTATGASVAESAPLSLDLSTTQTAMARTEVAALATEETDLAERRQDATAEAAALQGRIEAKEKAARDAAREAAAKKAKEAKLKAEGKRWVRPIGPWNQTSDFGMRWGKLHAGVDFGAATGTPLYAMSRGTVVFAGVMGGYGNKVEIKYWDGTTSYYGHMNSISAKVGDEVWPGDVVGEVGNTGHSFGSHLHLEIHPAGNTANTSGSGGAAIDPLPWLKEHGLIK